MLVVKVKIVVCSVVVKVMLVFAVVTGFEVRITVVGNLEIIVVKDVGVETLVVVGVERLVVV